MKVYKIVYMDGSETPYEIFKQTEIVKASDIADHVETMNAEGRICEDNYEIFKEKHPQGVMTEADALELLEMDGYSVEAQTL